MVTLRRQTIVIQIVATSRKKTTLNILIMTKLVTLKSTVTSSKSNRRTRRKTKKRIKIRIT